METSFQIEKSVALPLADIAFHPAGEKATVLVRDSGRAKKVGRTAHKTLVLTHSSPYNRDQCFFASRRQKRLATSIIPYTREGPER